MPPTYHRYTHQSYTYHRNLKELQDSSNSVNDPILAGQSRFLEAPLVRQADGELKNDKIFTKLPNWIFLGGVVEHPVTDVTPTMLTPNVISTLRQADHLANQVLNANQESKNNLSQMPLVLIPIHFDRYEYLVNSRFELSGL